MQLIFQVSAPAPRRLPATRKRLMHKPQSQQRRLCIHPARGKGASAYNGLVLMVLMWFGWLCPGADEAAGRRGGGADEAAGQTRRRGRRGGGSEAGPVVGQPDCPGRGAALRSRATTSPGQGGAARDDLPRAARWDPLAMTVSRSRCRPRRPRCRWRYTWHRRCRSRRYGSRPCRSCSSPPRCSSCRA